MSKKILAVLSVLLCFSLIFYGCKSKPETEDENPVEEVAPGQMTEEEILKAAQETARKAEEAKAKIDSEDLAKYDSKSYEKGEAALNQYKDFSAQENVDAGKLWDSSKEALTQYEKVLAAAEKAKAEEEAARQAALAEAQKLENAKKAFAEAQRYKEKIDNENLKEFDAASYDSGEAAMQEYQDLLAKGASNDELLVAAQKALDSYNAVLNAAYAHKASEVKAQVEDVRKKGLEIKADKAEKENFDATQLVYISAEDNYVNGQYVKAYEGYVESLEPFNKIYNVVSDKKARADAAIERAKNKSAESEEFAIQADEIAPLPEDAEGFEEESLEPESTEIEGDVVETESTESEVQGE